MTEGSQTFWEPSEESCEHFSELSHQKMGQLGYLYTTFRSLLVEAAPGETQSPALPVFTAPKLSMLPQYLREQSGQVRGSHTEVGSCVIQGTNHPPRCRLTHRWAEGCGRGISRVCYNILLFSFFQSDLQELPVFSKYIFVSYLLCHLQSIACLLTLFIVSEILILVSLIPSVISFMVFTFCHLKTSLPIPMSQKILYFFFF